MNGRDVLAAVWRQKLVALLVLFATVTATGAYLVVAPKVYRAQATLTLVPPPSATASNGADHAIGDFTAVSGALLPTLADVAVSEPVLDAARRRLPPTISTSELRGKVIGSAVLQTLILRIDATDGNAQRAADIANAVSTALIARNPSSRLGGLSLVDPASAPGSSGPDPVPSAAIGLILGLVLATALAVVIDRRRNQLVSGILDIEQVSDAPVLARLGVAGKGDPTGEMLALGARLHQEMDRTGRMTLVVLESERASGLPHISEQLAQTFQDDHRKILALHGPPRTALPSSQVYEPGVEPALSAAQGTSVGVAIQGSPEGTRQLTPSMYEMIVDESLSYERVSLAIAEFDIVVADVRHPALAGYITELLRKGSVLLIVRLSTARRSHLKRISRQLKERGTAVSGVVLT